MNHKVHWFAKGCLTLKCSGSWKTVTICSSGNFSEASAVPLPPSGDIGMVSRGTGDFGKARLAMPSVAVSTDMIELSNDVICQSRVDGLGGKRRDAGR